MKDNERERPYISPLRQEQKEITRDRIIDAVQSLINEGQILDFSIKDVADRAGVSYGSVYKHFPTRQSLLEALYEKASEIMDQTAPFKLYSLTDLPAMAEKTMAVFQANASTVEAFTTALFINKVQPYERAERDSKMQQMLMENNPNLDLAEARKITAIISHLYSSLTWVTLKERFRLDSEETADTLTWALHTLIQASLNMNKKDA